MDASSGAAVTARYSSAMPAGRAAGRSGSSRRRSGTEALTRTPVEDAQRPAQPPTQVGEVGDIGLLAGEPEEQLRQGVERYEQPCGHRDRNRQQDQPLPREVPPEG